MCEMGGARRSWLHGLAEATKRYLMYVAGKNLGVIMRSLFGMGKPRTLQTEGGGGFSSIWAGIWSYVGSWRAFCGLERSHLLCSGVPTSSKESLAILKSHGA